MITNHPKGMRCFLCWLLLVAVGGLTLKSPSEYTLWYEGADAYIEWNGASKHDTFELAIIPKSNSKSSRGAIVLRDKVQGEGKFHWRLPTNCAQRCFNEERLYYVRFTSVTGHEHLLPDAGFTIRPRRLVILHPPRFSPNSIYYPGQELTLDWRTEGIGTQHTVSIFLRSNTTYSLVTNGPSEGETKIHIPTEVTEGDQYFLRFVTSELTDTLHRTLQVEARTFPFSIRKRRLVFATPEDFVTTSLSVNWALIYSSFKQDWELELASKSLVLKKKTEGCDWTLPPIYSSGLYRLKGTLKSGEVIGESGRFFVSSYHSWFIHPYPRYVRSPQAFTGGVLKIVWSWSDPQHLVQVVDILIRSRKNPENKVLVSAGVSLEDKDIGRVRWKIPRTLPFMPKESLELVIVPLGVPASIGISGKFHIGSHQPCRNWHSLFKSSQSVWEQGHVDASSVFRKATKPGIARLELVSIKKLHQVIELQGSNWSVPFVKSSGFSFIRALGKDSRVLAASSPIFIKKPPSRPFLLSPQNILYAGEVHGLKASISGTILLSGVSISGDRLACDFATGEHQMEVDGQSIGSVFVEKNHGWVTRPLFGDVFRTGGVLDVAWKWKKCVVQTNATVVLNNQTILASTTGNSVRIQLPSVIADSKKYFVCVQPLNICSESFTIYQANMDEYFPSDSWMIENEIITIEDEPVEKEAQVADEQRTPGVWGALVPFVALVSTTLFVYRNELFTRDQVGKFIIKEEIF